MCSGLKRRESNNRENEKEKKKRPLSSLEEASRQGISNCFVADSAKSSESQVFASEEGPLSIFYVLDHLSVWLWVGMTC